jgi:DNA-binding MarR family transcriptional regulator
MSSRSPNSADLARELRITLGRIGRRFSQLYADAGTVSGLAFTEASVLLRLAREGPNSPGALARLERVTPQSVGSVLTALESQGLISRTPDPSDGRKVIVAITEQGQLAFGERAQALTAYLERVLETDLTADERKQIAAVLPLLERVADKL